MQGLLGRFGFFHKFLHVIETIFSAIGRFSRFRVKKSQILKFSDIVSKLSAEGAVGVFEKMKMRSFEFLFLASRIFRNKSDFLNL